MITLNQVKEMATDIHDIASGNKPVLDATRAIRQLAIAIVGAVQNVINNPDEHFKVQIRKISHSLSDMK